MLWSLLFISSLCSSLEIWQLDIISWSVKWHQSRFLPTRRDSPNGLSSPSVFCIYGHAVLATFLIAAPAARSLYREMPGIRMFCRVSEGLNNWMSSNSSAMEFAMYVINTWKATAIGEIPITTVVERNPISRFSDSWQSIRISDNLQYRRFLDLLWPPSAAKSPIDCQTREIRVFASFWAVSHIEPTLSSTGYPSHCRKSDTLKIHGFLQNPAQYIKHIIDEMIDGRLRSSETPIF